jgi:tRNA(Ile)-lysidine synthase
MLSADLGQLREELAGAEEDPTRKMPITAEEALALYRAALGNDPCTGLLLAVSGGPDSMALLGLAAAARAYLPPLAVVTVDHGLRPESKAEAASVAEFATELELPHCTLPWLDHPEYGVSQEAARKARYAMLMGHARALDATHLVTAHTLDDQAETVLMRMASGSGVGGLAGMRPNVRRGAIGHLRPFLEVPKSRILATCEKYSWYYADDPTNKDQRYTRTRMRALIPILASEGLTAERLGTLAERARRTDDAIEHVAKRHVEEAVILHAPDGGAVRLRSALFGAEPFEIALRMVRRAMLDIATEDESEKHIPLAKLEVLLKDLRGAIKDQRPFRRTLAWAIIAHGGTTIEIRRAPPRRKA